MAALGLALAGNASAASCLPAPPRAKLDVADAAFVGRLERTVAIPGRRDRIDYLFVVDQVVKGELGRRVSVRSGVGQESLGFSLERDVATGILLNREGAVWRGGLCGQVTPSELVEATRGDEQIVNWGGVVVGVLVLAGGAYFLRRKLNRNRYRPAP
ncbi:MAG: hypothetical protein ACR2GT_08170 [Gaiellaceae bacterium]